MVKIKLCLVIPSLQAGGMERVMSELVKYFAATKNLEIHLILYGGNREIFYQVPEDIILYKPGFVFNNQWRFINTLRTLKYLRQTVKRINPGSILSFGELWNSFVMLSLIGFKYPVYISDRCSPEKKFSPIHQLLRSYFYPRSKGIIAQTDKARERYLEQFKHPNIRVIANPIRFILGTKEDERENIVLNVGRLINSKHQDRLIKLFLELNIPRWKLVLVGYDHLKQSNFNRLQEIIENYQGEDKVILVGKHVDVDSFYKKSKVFAFTSSSEGFPNVIGEALSAGLPVISYDCIAGPSDLITQGENGFLIPVFDDRKFQQQLRFLINNEEIRKEMSENAKMSISNLSIQVIGKQYLEFILE